MSRQNYVVVRVGGHTRSSVKGAMIHNERKKDNHANPDIIPERKKYNQQLIENYNGELYTEVFDRLVEEKKISTTGLKGDAVLFNELLYDVNSEYWLSYDPEKYESEEDFATAYFKDCLKHAKKKYGEDNIISAEIHADEINRPLTEKYGRPVYHYHMHVVAIPTVTKEKLWSKRCKDEKLRGTVKEVITQVSNSKFWAFKDGKPSYTDLQDEVYEHLHEKYPDLRRGEKGSKAKHLAPEQYKAKQDELRELDDRIQEKGEIIDEAIIRTQTAQEEAEKAEQEKLMKEQELLRMQAELQMMQQRNLLLAQTIEENEEEIELLEKKLGIIADLDEYESVVLVADKMLDRQERTIDHLLEVKKSWFKSIPDADKWIDGMKELLQEWKEEIKHWINKVRYYETAYEIPEESKKLSSLDDRIKQIEEKEERLYVGQNQKERDMGR